VGAENQLGIAAESPPGDPFALSVIDDSDASIMYSTGWTPTTNAAAYRGTLHTISTAGSTATMPFSDGSVAIVAPVGPSSGSMQVCFDAHVSVAGCTTVSLRSSTAVDREVVYVSARLAGSHTIEITTSGGGPVALDGFVVLS
jgi:hypothetical protein